MMPRESAAQRSRAVGVAHWLCSALLLVAGGASEAGSVVDLSVRQPPPDVAEGWAVIDGSGEVTQTLIVLFIDFACDAPWQPHRLFVSVADSAFTKDLAEIPTPGEVRLGVPVAQLRGLRQGEWCAATEDTDRRGQVLRQHATAFATLSCSNGDSELQVATVSTPLDLMIQCGESSSEPVQMRSGVDGRIIRRGSP